jgi:hypothetical protein
MLFSRDGDMLPKSLAEEFTRVSVRELDNSVDGRLPLVPATLPFRFRDCLLSSSFALTVLFFRFSGLTDEEGAVDAISAGFSVDAGGELNFSIAAFCSSTR